MKKLCPFFGRFHIWFHLGLAVCIEIIEAAFSNHFLQAISSFISQRDWGFTSCARRRRKVRWNLRISVDLATRGQPSGHPTRWTWSPWRKTSEVRRRKTTSVCWRDFAEKKLACWDLATNQEIVESYWIPPKQGSHGSSWDRELLKMERVGAQ